MEMLLRRPFPPVVVLWLLLPKDDARRDVQYGAGLACACIIATPVGNIAVQRSGLCDCISVTSMILVKQHSGYHQEHPWAYGLLP